MLNGKKTALSYTTGQVNVFVKAELFGMFIYIADLFFVMQTFYI